jgi:hypothetical protein
MSKQKRKRAQDNSGGEAWAMQGPAVRRIEKGQTGFDPLGAQQEAAFAQGLFLRNLLTGRLRTNKLWVLLVMSLAGICLLLPLALSVIEWSAGAILSAPLFFVIPMTLGALLLFWNVALNVWARRSD